MRYRYMETESDGSRQTKQNKHNGGRLATCLDDTAGGERKGEMERDIESSGMRGV